MNEKFALAKVLVRAGGNLWEYSFSRVPIIGEHVKLDGKGYVVQQVVHTPKSDCAAEITVSLNS